MNNISYGGNTPPEKTNIFYEDFIGYYENKFSDKLCDKLIKVFDKAEKNNSIGFQENNSKHRIDKIIDLQSQDHLYPDLVFNCNLLIFDCVKDYVNKYPTIKDIKPYNPKLNLQKTIAGGGFHNWHYEKCESMMSFDSDRTLVWMVYLNDDFEGGETEFIYYQKRIIPKKGTVLIFPPGYTHTHRGGMVINREKYILTGWIYKTGWDDMVTRYAKAITENPSS
jgi:hypothetical protein